jgi:RNA polymerase sigma factor (sigma-70 family)
MTDAPDSLLLAQFARDQSEAAFAELVQRYVALVHSVALRHTANPEHARDITQAVFIILARKAGALGCKTVLPGWLYHTARLTAANFQRAEARRVRREREACMQSTPEESAHDALWRELSPQLDEAMGCLGTSERDALVLRYFQNKSVAEVGEFLGLAENTAQKRVSRALEKLRKFFVRRGVDSTAAAIGDTISVNSIQAAPAALAKSVTAVALAKGAAASVSTLTLVKGALKIMAWTKAKTAIVVGLGVLLAAGTTPLAIKRVMQTRMDVPNISTHSFHWQERCDDGVTRQAGARTGSANDGPKSDLRGDY